MAEQSNYVDLRINVNGQIHNVRVQKGITFGKPCDGYFMHQSPSVWTCEENGVNSTTMKPKNDIYYSEIVSLTGAKKEIKMSEAEFALFRNVANNVNEGGVLTLSDKDIKDAQNKYTAGEFTKDISKDLPKGCKARRSDQDLYEKGVVGRLNTTSMGFLMSSSESLLKTVKPYIDKSPSGNVELTYSEGCLDGISYKKDNKTYYGGFEGKIDRIEYDDADGKHVNEYYIDNGNTLDWTEKEWKENEKSITEITNYSNPDYSHREEKYVDDKGRKVFDVYKDNVLKSRSLKYTLNGKHFEEKYENGKLTSKIAHYRTKESIHYDNGYDEYDDKGRLSKQRVDNHTWKYEYNDKGERELLYEVVPLVYKVTGYPAGSRIKKYGAQIDLNYQIQNVKTFAGLDIEKNKKVESSEKVEKYKKEFHHKGEETIAATIKDQIDGFSRNDKTLAMVDAIPEDKAITVLKYYKELSSFWGKEKPLFVALEEEMGIGKEEIMPIMRRFCAIYLGQKSNADEITKEDVELAKKIQAGCPDGEDFTQYMKDIDALLTR